MHTILKVTMSDLERANACISEGRLPKIIEEVSKIMKPETAFYYSDNGYRAALFVFDLVDTSVIPSIAEPFFTELNARVEFIPAMNQEELGRGLDSWQRGSHHASSQNWAGGPV